MRGKLTLGAIAAAIVLLGAAVVLRLGVAPSGSEGRRNRPGADGGASRDVSVAAAEASGVLTSSTPKPPTSVSGKATRELTDRLDALRVEESHRKARRVKLTPEQEILETSRREEVDRMIAALKERLEAHPEEWPEVVEQLTWVKNLMVVLRTTRELSPIVDPSVEPLLMQHLRFGARKNGRRAAVALLADSPSPDTIPAFVEAVERDEDSGVRFAAFLELVRRGRVPEFQSQAALIDQTIKKQTEVERDPGVKRLMVQYLPGNAPKPPPFTPRHRGGVRSRSSSSR